MACASRNGLATSPIADHLVIEAVAKKKDDVNAGAPLCRLCRAHKVFLVGLCVTKEWTTPSKVETPKSFTFPKQSQAVLMEPLQV